MYFITEIGTLIKRFRLANKLTFYLTTIFLYLVHHSIPKVRYFRELLSVLALIYTLPFL